MVNENPCRCKFSESGESYETILRSEFYQQLPMLDKITEMLRMYHISVGKVVFQPFDLRIMVKNA